MFFLIYILTKTFVGGGFCDSSSIDEEFESMQTLDHFHRPRSIPFQRIVRTAGVNLIAPLTYGVKIYAKQFRIISLFCSCYFLPVIIWTQENFLGTSGKQLTADQWDFLVDMDSGFWLLSEETQNCIDRVLERTCVERALQPLMQQKIGLLSVLSLLLIAVDQSTEINPPDFPPVHTIQSKWVSGTKKWKKKN